MKDIYSIVKKPVITEKVTMMLGVKNKVAFWVEPSSNKNEIKRAVEKIFNVTVLDVNTEKVPGKIKKVGRFEGKTSTRKKAYITLKEGDKIPIFEGV
uniref:Large ribosomal subunit protein uL23 n=1 Tax=uncultured delta proteobacterium Rifle_16ft_4_minimus_10129 TaxID=1665172 RepID=A0A0H4T244_9DELT|nr:50S ribosomal protein L23, large subunit ribosomal protein L23 [uncultured delta proteobacterium Rifle_16ft_4_minimus_10129]